MKRKIFILLLFVGFLVSCSPSKKDLYVITDSFIDSLQTKYDSYGVLGGKDNVKTTNDGEYQVMPVGRLINVKILKVVDEKVYKDLEGELKNHYKNDKRVNDIYISNGGTIMIDCRN